MPAPLSTSRLETPPGKRPWTHISPHEHQTNVTHQVCEPFTAPLRRHVEDLGLSSGHHQLDDDLQHRGQSRNQLPSLVHFADDAQRARTYRSHFRSRRWTCLCRTSASPINTAAPTHRDRPSRAKTTRCHPMQRATTACRAARDCPSCPSETLRWMEPRSDQNCAARDKKMGCESDRSPVKPEVLRALAR